MKPEYHYPKMQEQFVVFHETGLAFSTSALRKEMKSKGKTEAEIQAFLMKNMQPLPEGFVKPFGPNMAFSPAMSKAWSEGLSHV